LGEKKEVLFIGTQFSNLSTAVDTSASAACTKIKGHPGDFAIARNDLDNTWQSLRKMYEKEDDPVEALIDRLQAEQHLEMMRLHHSLSCYLTVSW
jgi:hypothetical protein